MNKKHERAIRVIGAREHNLKALSVEIPKDVLTVITGPSGSGKSSLALDVLHAEGQRRYMESLSSYARQFLGMPKKPDVDRIEGLCPSIAIDQKTVGANPRSTVGTITEIYDYLRILFARIGKPRCPKCSIAIEAGSPAQIRATIAERHAQSFVTIAAPIARERKGEFVNQIQDVFDSGFRRFVIDGQKYTFKSREEIAAVKLQKTYKHDIDVLIDALDVVPAEYPRLLEAIEKACSLAKGMCKVIKGQEESLYSTDKICAQCGFSFPELEPRFFSFNSPLGACRECHGLGVTTHYPWHAERMKGMGDEFMLDTEEEGYSLVTCGSCYGKRLNETALAVYVGSKNIYELGELSIAHLRAFFTALRLESFERQVAERLLHEITSRVRFLDDVGLSYLSLNRRAETLSGGEGQRIRLATQIGASLSGVLYVLDEPSIGLHQRDNDKLIATLHTLRDQGNTVLVVEHDTDTMLQADYLIDMGPEAGIHGGQIVAAGTPQEVMKHPQSVTGAYLSGKKRIVKKQPVRRPKGWISITEARKNNLKDVSVKLPLGVLCAVSGVSGSGKSTLIMEEFVPLLQHALYKRRQDERISGYEGVEDIVVIDQKPIGRTPRSNPSTYLGIFDEVRKLFASLPESNARGYAAGRFSFNVGGGRCATCSGEGIITVSMHFLPDVTLPCKDCKGLRYNQQTLDITYKGKHIADVLQMSAEEALVFFQHHPRIAKRLQLLCDVGLSYITLGQASTTLSGGEAQRIKLVDELAKRGARTIYVLDEPTTGLHSSDIERLLGVFDRLLEKGNTILVIEHNLDVLKTADYIIDMGPEGGDEGGYVVATGTPHEVAQNTKSHTGRYLKRLMDRERR